MSDYWLNRIGAAAQATTSTGQVPEYGLAYDLGTAEWPDSQTFNTAVTDAVARRRSDDLDAMEQAREEAESSWFNRNFMGNLAELIGDTPASMVKNVPVLGTYLSYGLDALGIGEDDPEFRGDSPEAEQARTERGGERLEAFANAPGIKQYNEVYDAITRFVETPLILDRNTAISKKMSLWFDPSAWAQAWREAEDRTLGEAFADAIFTEQGDTLEDIERRRQTNSLYGMTSFATELVGGFKLDPAVLGAKALGETQQIRKGVLPRGTSNRTTAREARRVLQAEDPRAYRYMGLNPAGHYGVWRGRKLYDRFDALRAAALDQDFTDFSNLPMFRNNSVNGPQAALAFQIAAKDDAMWDLTRRLVMGDAESWGKLRAMRERPDMFPEFFQENTDAATFIDAIDATKTRAKGLQSEIADLEKRIADRGGLPEAMPSSQEYKGKWYHREPKGSGFHDYYTWELHKDLEAKQAQLLEHEDAITKYGGDYEQWLRSVDSGNGPIHVDQVGTKRNKVDLLESRTYQKSPFGAAHRVSRIPKTLYLRKANSIDLHRSELGVMSIRRQFEQFRELFGYTVDRDVLNDTLKRFTTARTTQERWEIAQEVEDVHLIGAASQKYNLSPDTIDLFLRQTRMRRNEMAEALRAGKGAIYSTADVDNPLQMGDSATVVGKDAGMVKIEVMDNGVKHTMVVPEESLEGYALPVDPTQTPQYYQPMDTREVDLAIKHNPELFELLDSDVKHYGRRAAAATMNKIDKYGTRFNQFWKPIQLFRLAWPQRVLMDEWFRSMAILGVSAWSRAYLPALRISAQNAINPTLHNFGIVDRWKRRFTKIGPGPVADRAAGRKIDTLAHEAAADAAPVVPEKFLPKFDARRADTTRNFLSAAIPLKARRARARALLRDPNPTKSLPDDLDVLPENWQDIDSALANHPGSYENGYSLFDQVQPSDDGLVLGGTVGEGFDTSDLVYAEAAIRYSPEDLIGELSGTGDLGKIERFLNAPSELQARIWNGDVIESSDPAFRAIADIADEFRPRTAEDASGRTIVSASESRRASTPSNRPETGRLRDRVRQMVKDGKKEFEKEVRRRKSGAGHGPLFSGAFDANRLGTLSARLEMMMAKELGAKWIPIDRMVFSTSSFGSSGPLQRRFVVPGGVTNVHNGDNFFYDRTLRAINEAIEKRKVSTSLFDPLSGRVTKQGWAVRVDTVDLPEVPGDRPQILMHTPGEFFDAIDDFVLKNQDFLSAKGFRLLVESDAPGRAKLSVVRYFNTPQKDAAIEFARHVEAPSLRRIGGLKNQSRAGRQIDEATEGGAEYYIKDDDRSPVMEQLDRLLRDEHEYDAAGDLSTTPAPIEGYDKPAYHGTVRDLPERLAPRSEAPLDNGRMLGPGFYTAYDPPATHSPYGTAQAFGPNIYTIKGTRDGRLYRAQPMQERPARDILERIREALNGHREAVRGLADEFYPNEGQWDRRIDEILERMDHPYSWDELLGLTNTWDNIPYELRLDEWLLDYLMREEGIGAWYAKWGNTDVFVWFDPENLVIKPAYETVEKWYKIEDWLTHPASRERIVNQVPENRIIRTRRNDPEFRELETLHNRRVAMEKADGSQYDNPVYDALLGREAAMMRRLGLEYSHNMARKGKVGDQQNWWTQTNPGAPAASRYLDSLNRSTSDISMGAVQELDQPLVDFQALLRAAGDRGSDFGRRLLRKREYAKGTATVRSADGKDISYHQLLEGEGDIYAPLLSAAPTYARLTDTYKRTLSKFRARAVGYKRRNPPDVSPETLATRTGRKVALEYYAEWTDLLNDQIRNSPIWWRMLDGQSDDQIVSWLTGTHEGARIRQALPHKGRNPEKWVEEHRARLDQYLPDENKRAILRERKLRPEELWDLDPDLRPDIYTPDLEEVSQQTVFSKLVEKVYHGLGTVPTDLLSRQPYAKAMYDLKMRNLIAAADSEFLTPAMMKQYEKLSREFAIRQVRRVLYDLTDESNFTQMIRFVSPFWGAQQDAITKWMNIAVERPETVARFYVGLDRTYDHFVVIDENGEEVKDRSVLDYDPNDRVLLHIPKRLKKLPFFQRALDEFGNVGISFGAANTALQGDIPLAPSLGPLVTVPADWMADAMWETNGAQFEDNTFYRWLFPIGRPKAPGSVGEFLEQMMPGWGRRMQALQDGQDSRVYMNTWSIIQREKYFEAAQRGEAPPSPEEIDEETKWHFILRTVASFALPASMEFRPENQFFLDAYHKMQREYGPGRAFEEFYKKYGRDAAKYAASTSSRGYAPATSEGLTEWSGIKDIVRDAVATNNEDLATAFYSPEAWTADFSSDSYSEQFKIGVGPGTSTKLRESQDPIARQHATDRRVGWLEYRQLNSALSAELYNRGLTSLEQIGAEDLKAVKQQWVAMREDDNSPEYNPAWAQDYREYSDTIYQQVDFLAKYAFDPRFDSRPDIQGLRQYLLIRDATAQSLDQWGAQGGSRNLQAQENTELRNWFYDQVGQLVMANPSFGEFYIRFLDSDRLERGSG